VSTGNARRWHILGRLLGVVLLGGIALAVPATPAAADDVIPARPCVRISVYSHCAKIPLYPDPPLCEVCPMVFDYRLSRVLPVDIEILVGQYLSQALDAAATGDDARTASALGRVAAALGRTVVVAVAVGYLSPDGALVPCSNASLDTAIGQVAAGVGYFQQAVAQPALARQLQQRGLAALANAIELIGDGTPLPA
jgi:hypothetical protein